MADPLNNDTLDFSALDVLSSSSTPRLLAKDRSQLVHIAHMADQNNNHNNEDHAPDGREDVASEYSIHLSALGPHSASSTLNLEREIMQINSDDVGGPSDFTLNMVDWLNSDRVSKAAPVPTPAATQQYKQPSVEESNTPMPIRSKHIPAWKVDNGDLLKSSQCLTTPPQKPQEDLYAQLAALQAKCTRLQQSNDEMARMLEAHRTDIDRQASLEAQLRREQDLREEERLAAEQAQDNADRELQRAEERCQRLQDILNAERAATASAQADVELVQQDLHVQVATWKQHANEARRKHAEIEAGGSQTPQDDAQVQQLQEELASLKQSHKKEVQTIRQEYEGVAKDVDDWVVAKVKAKDEHYAAVDAKRKATIAKLQARNKELEQLYSLCGKELMLSWGREEFGPPSAGQRQKYRYQS